ncbi:hypothetical protein ACX6XY_19560 [Streptomyces sp. O3]
MSDSYPLSLLRAPRAGRDARLVRDLPRLLLGGRQGPVPLAEGEPLDPARHPIDLTA